MRTSEELEQEDQEIVQGLRAGSVDLRARRAQRAIRSMHRREQAVSNYTDPWIEEAESRVRYVPPAPVRMQAPPPPVQPKPILTQKQKDLVLSTLFGDAAPTVSAALEMAGSETGQKIVGVGSLALGAMLLPFAGAIRR